MSQFHKLISSVRAALENGWAEEQRPPAAVRDEPVPVAEAARRAELAFGFARELEALGGRFLGVLAPDEAARRAAELAAELGARNVAVGAGVTLDFGPLCRELERAGCAVARTDEPGQKASAVIEQLAHSDLGVVEAHYAVSENAALAVVMEPGRPGTLTLLPTANLVFVRLERVMPDLAAVIAALGAKTIATRRVAFIAGPSRTADIEKRLVLGVHGPKELHVIVLWQGDQR